MQPLAGLYTKVESTQHGRRLMQVNRREWLSGGLGAVSTAALAGCGAGPQTQGGELAPVVSGGVVDWEAVRARFPRAVNETYFNCAAQHPLGVHTVRGFERYIDFMHV